MMTLRQQLLTLADSYRSSTGLSLSRISTIVFNDGKVLKRLSASGDLTTGRLEYALQWFSDHWPDTSEWPSKIARPTKQAA